MSSPPRAQRPTPDTYFQELWSRADDPWEHGSRWYEARKYALTVASLPRPRYRRGFEPGCGAGFLTQMLAPRVDHLVAMERSPRGADVTRRRCAGQLGVEVRRGRIPDDWPEGGFDLIVLSELLYYLDDDGLEAVLRRAGESLDDHGHLVAVHYRPLVEEHARRGDDAHRAIHAAFDAPHATYRDAEFVLDVFSAPSAPGRRDEVSHQPADRPT